VLDADELITRRLNEKLSQEDFARVLKISQSYLSEVESGRKKVSQALEARYDRLYPKRLVNLTTGRGVECPRCYGLSPLAKLSEPEDELDTVYHCADCDYYFTIGQAWGLHYRV
jgi:transcriptional regulator with XRE-family HTH domain